MKSHLNLLILLFLLCVTTAFSQVSENEPNDLPTDGNVQTVSSSGTTITGNVNASDIDFWHLGDNSTDMTASWTGTVNVMLREYSNVDRTDELSSRAIATGVMEILTSTNFYSLEISAGSTQSYSSVLTGLLPVELTYFRANKKEDKVELNWETRTEIDNDYFDIERSTDGSNFDKIGQVQGNGTTNEVHTYQFTDELPKSGVNYYRLKQVDFNREYEYSEIASISIKILSAKKIKIYPTLCHGSVTVENGVGQWIEIFDKTGKKVKSVKITGQKQTVAINLATGQYFAKYEGNSTYLVVY